MTLIVEDGTGKADAESYISVADATTYHANQGNTAWAAIATEALKEQALRRAWNYMTGEYRARWDGKRAGATQRGDWPRYMVAIRDIDGYLASDVIPADIGYAQAELALIASSEELAPDLERGVIREKIGPLEFEYDTAASAITTYRKVDMMVAPFLSRSGVNVRLSRA